MMAMQVMVARKDRYSPVILQREEGCVVMSGGRSHYICPGLAVCVRESKTVASEDPPIGSGLPVLPFPPDAMYSRIQVIMASMRSTRGMQASTMATWMALGSIKNSRGMGRYVEVWI